MAVKNKERSEKMAKKITAPFYTETKVGIRNLFHDTRLPDGCLYSKGIYRTKITAEDLPEHYIHGWIFKVQGYISVLGIKDIAYRPNYHINHLHRDDHLYISYDKKITYEADEHGRMWHHNYDAVLWGYMIVDFIRAVRKFQSYDIEPIADEVKKKEKFYREKYPEECERHRIDWLE